MTTIRRLRLPVLLLALGCGGRAASEPDTAADTLAPVESDLPTQACAGDVTLDWSLAPALGQQTAAWADGEIVLGVKPYEGKLEASVADGCVVLSPGVLVADLRKLRCGASEVKVAIVDTCGTSCTRLAVFAGQNPAGDDRNTRSNVEDSLGLAPGSPFTAFEISSLDARICATGLSLAPLPADLVPEDTAALF